jgi:cytochrome c biogenesis protein CcmG, thiol:disulfide interchange protein DsbE
VVDAINLGPFVLSMPRLHAALALALFLVVAEILARRQGARLSAWAWTTLWLVLLGARLGFVLENLSVYLAEPLSILYLWQGGFSPLWGLVAALLYSLWFLRSSPKLLHWAALPAALSLALWLGLSGLGEGAREPVTVPALSVERLDGKRLELGAGRPLVLNLWATWCPPCRRELPLLIETAKAHPQVDFVLLSQGETATTVTRYLQEEGLAADRVALDASRRASLALRASGLPTTLFFDAQGELVGRHMGEISRAALLNQLRQLGAD